MNDEIAVVVGVGPGLGWALVKRFSGAGMRVVAAARKPEKIVALASDQGIANVVAQACDVADEASVTALFKKTGNDLGTPNIVVFNAGAYAPGGILDIDTREFERCWRVGCFGGFLVGQAAARLMVLRGSGTIIFTGATAALRGSAGFANLAIPKFGLRALAQTMARELGPKGIHVAHTIIDGQIESERYRALAGQRGPDALLAPDAIAQSYLDLHRQPRSAWTQELDLRPWVEKF